ncbi:MAG: hypothetical protein IT393_05880 [Nitrospirae bacterium]|nr:hypothetical protein [Nitrospirota bacterium]
MNVQTLRSGCRAVLCFLVLSLIFAGCGRNDNNDNNIPGGFLWLAYPEEVIVLRGDQARFVLKISSISGVPLPRTASFSVSGLPAGADGFFLSDKFYLPAEVLLYVNTAPNTPIGSFPITISSSQTTEELSIKLTIKPMQWEQVNVNASDPQPPGLSNHSAVYDEGADRMIIFGGIVPGGLSADLWGLQDVTGASPVWNHVSTGGSFLPSARTGHKAVYDRDGKRMVIWGGVGQNEDFIVDRLWVLTNADGSGGTPAWIQLSEGAGQIPSSRLGFSMVYDPGSNRVILFGGAETDGDTTTLLNDVWVLTNANGLGGDPAWVNITPASGSIPNPRMMHSAVYDSNNNRMIVFGGGAKSGPLNDVWVLTHANGLDENGQDASPSWQPLTVSGNLPDARTGHAAVFNPSKNSMTIFGGADGQEGLLDDLWIMENANGIEGPAIWSSGIIFHNSKVSYPDARANHSAVINVENDTMAVFGGLIKNTYSNETSSNETWLLRHASGEE